MCVAGRRLGGLGGLDGCYVSRGFRSSRGGGDNSSSGICPGIPRFYPEPLQSILLPSLPVHVQYSPVLVLFEAI